MSDNTQVTEETLNEFKSVDGYYDHYWETVDIKVREEYRILFCGFKKTFESPAHLVAFYDSSIRDGKVNIHGWQARIHTEILSKIYTDQNPLELILRAVNGSGKDLMVIAPFVVWCMMTNLRSLLVATSSSAAQLNNQTEKHIRKICQAVNTYHGFDIFDIKQRNIKCNITGAEIYLYATDEPGKAEGYHPVEPGRVLVIIVNEAKSVQDEIFEALTRCTGFTHWIEVSSPGKPDGHFYLQNISERKNLIKLVVISDDCPHLGLSYRERLRDIYGENHYLYKSMVLAEFSSSDEQVVLPYEKFERCIKYPPIWIRDDNGNVAGLDLSMGGDEQVLTIRNGNKVISQLHWKEKDVTTLVNKLEAAFKQYHLEGRPIYADAGGLGKHFIDLLRMRGWKNVKYVYNQTDAKQVKLYKNIGTEMWFDLATLVENQSIILEGISNDLTTKKQLCNRYFKFVNKDDTTVAMLETKPQARAKGHPSPDRADSLALCFKDYITPSAVEQKAKRLKDIKEANNNNLNNIPSIKLFVRNNTHEHNVKLHTASSGIINAKLNNRISKNEILRELEQTQEYLQQYRN
jgi:phage terminase large subunit